MPWRQEPLLVIKFAGKIFQDVIISVFSINVCTQICYNGWGGANSLELISPPHKPCDLFRLCPEALAIFDHGFWLAGGGSIYCHRSIPPTRKYTRWDHAFCDYMPCSSSLVLWMSWTAVVKLLVLSKCSCTASGVAFTTYCSFRGYEGTRLNINTQAKKM